MRLDGEVCEPGSADEGIDLIVAKRGSAVDRDAMRKETQFESCRVEPRASSCSCSFSCTTENLLWWLRAVIFTH